MAKLTTRHITALRWAVAQAHKWRGYWVGTPNPGPLAAHDKEVQIAREALRLLPKPLKTPRRIKHG